MVNKPSNAQRNLAVSFTTCAPQQAPQLLNYLRTSTLATYAASHHPTTHPTTCAPQLRGHLCNIYSGFAQPTSSTQACQLGDLVHLHCSHPWSPHPTNFVPLRSNILHGCALQDPIPSHYTCVVSPLPVCWAFACTICDLCLIGHLYYVSHQYCNYIRVFQVFGIRNICSILKHLPLIASNINSNRQWSTRNRGEDWATNRWAAFLQFDS